MSSQEPNPEVTPELPALPGPEHLLPDDLEDLQEQLQTESRWEFVRRRQSLLTSGLLALAVVLMVLAVYAFPVLARHSLLLTDAAALKPAVNAASVRLQELDRKQKDNDILLTALLMDQQDLRDQLQGPGASHKAAIASAGSDGVSALRTRVTKLEALRTGDQSHIAELQQQLSQVRAQLELETRDLRATRQQLAGQMDENAQKAGRQIASLSEDQQRARTDVSRITSNLAVERIGFEVSKGHSTQLAPGISLGLTKTDVAHHRADGWLWVMPDRRTIWLRAQTAQEPLTFYGASDGRRRELVITQVTRDSVVGYLLLSRHPDAAGSPGAERAAASPSGDPNN